MTVRPWRHGDRMRPAGLGGSKTLQDLFTDRKVPRAERASWPVVEAGGEIACVENVARFFDGDGELAFQNEAVFEPVMGNRLIGVSGAGRVFVHGDGKSARFVLAQDAADDMLRGFDGLCVRTAHDESLFRQWIVGDKI